MAGQRRPPGQRFPRPPGPHQFRHVPVPPLPGTVRHRPAYPGAYPAQMPGPMLSPGPASPIQEMPNQRPAMPIPAFNPGPQRIRHQGRAMPGAMPMPHAQVAPMPNGFVVDESPPGYSIEKKLGEGGFGSVFRAKNLSTNRICALKSVDVGCLSQKYRDHAIKQWLVEIASLVKVADHPNVVGYYKAFDTGWKLWVEMEFCAGGDLAQYMSGWKTRISRSVKLKIMQDIAAAITYLHKQRIVHRDIKAQNVLVAYRTHDTLDVTAKLADFGLAKVIENCNFEETYYMDATCGTKYYLAPEVIKGHYTEMADVFSMAVLFTAIVTESKIPGHGYMTSYIKDESGKIWSFAEYMAMTKADVAMRSSFTAGGNLRSLLNSMLLFDYHKRPTADEVNSTMSDAISIEDIPKNPKSIKRGEGDRPVPSPR